MFPCAEMRQVLDLCAAQKCSDGDRTVDCHFSATAEIASKQAVRRMETEKAAWREKARFGNWKPEEYTNSTSQVRPDVG